MAIAIHRKQVKFYIGLAVAFLLLNLVWVLLSDPWNFLKRTANNCWLIPCLAFVNFILFEYTLPYFRLNWRRILAGLVLIWLHLMIYSFGVYGWRTLGIELHVYFSIREFKSTSEALSYFTGYSMSSVFFFGIVRHVYNYIKLKNDTKQLRIEKQEAELNFLKSQTNPHFLFNTLNNIYSLSRDKSDMAPESILRLSKILRFMLYETGGEYIAIEQELKIISDYIALEKLRYDDSLRISFNYDVEDMKQALPPLLLIPLVENAFKHGASETPGHPFVDVHLSVNKRQLAFTVKNSSEQVVTDEKVKENIGLANLRRQLELLYTDYNLSVKQGPAVFTALLTINLASHV
jgi:sensor histidine kinase YesM